MKRFAALAAGLLLLAGCGAANPAPTPLPEVPPGSPYSAADIMFLQMMVPHHEQGLTLVRLAHSRAARPEIRTLAAAIESTQTTEVVTMSERLHSWHQPLTAPPGTHADHGGMPDTTAREITTLKKLSGPAFDRRFLNTLIAHQDDAIQLARLESATGTDPATKALATSIDHSRSAQIHQMLTYLEQR